MASTTHQNFVSLMQRLVAKHGRTVYIRRQVGTVPVDATRPELGLQTDSEDTEVSAAFLDADMRDLLLSLPGEPDQQTLITRNINRVVLIPASGLTFELDKSHQIVDGTDVLEITLVAKIKPGPTLIGYAVAVGR